MCKRKKIILSVYSSNASKDTFHNLMTGKLVENWKKRSVLLLMFQPIPANMLIYIQVYTKFWGWYFVLVMSPRKKSFLKLLIRQATGIPKYSVIMKQTRGTYVTAVGIAASTFTSRSYLYVQLTWCCQSVENYRVHGVHILWNCGI